MRGTTVPGRRRFRHGSYLPGLLARVERGEIDPSFIITHRVTLDFAPLVHRTFREKQDQFIKVVMRPCDPTPRQVTPINRPSV